MEPKEYGVAANGISLHVTELGDGPVVVFCHGNYPENGVLSGLATILRDCNLRLNQSRRGTRPVGVVRRSYAQPDRRTLADFRGLIIVSMCA
jgi:hypothetical protein